jgi:quinol monooxygenase YgiN
VVVSQLSFLVIFDSSFVSLVVSGRRMFRSTLRRTFSTIFEKFPGYNQVILSRGKTKAQCVQQFYPLATEFAKLLVENVHIPRFDILRDHKDPSNFVFLEVYNASGAFAQHVDSERFDQFQVVAEPLLEDPFDLEEFKTIYPTQVSIDLTSLSHTLFSLSRSPLIQDEWKQSQPLVPQAISTSIGEGLIVVCVTLHVKPETINEFLALTTQHCHESMAKHYQDHLQDPSNVPCPSHLR